MNEGIPLNEVISQHALWCAENHKGKRADLSYGDLRGTNLSGALLDGATLKNCDLRGVDLRGAKLNGANLSHADLRGADLRGTEMQNANLSHARLQGADLQGAMFKDADLHGATGLRPQIFVMMPLEQCESLIGPFWNAS